MSANAEVSSRSMARSPMLRMPTGRSPSTTGSRRIALRRISWAASSISVLGVTVIRSPSLHASRTGVLKSLFSATMRMTMSRSVTMPANRPPSRTSTSPMSLTRICRAASLMGASIETVAGEWAMTSATVVAINSSFILSGWTSGLRYPWWQRHIGPGWLLAAGLLAGLELWVGLFCRTSLYGNALPGACGGLGQPQPQHTVLQVSGAGFAFHLTGHGYPVVKATTAAGPLPLVIILLTRLLGRTILADDAQLLP